MHLSQLTTNGWHRNFEQAVAPGAPFQAISRSNSTGYLQKLRVEKAKRLLEEGTRTFEEITYQVGYEDVPFFRKIFVRLAG